MSRRVKELEKSFKKSRKSELFVEHHYKNYAGNFPVWVAMEVTSFGTIAKLYKNLKEELKKNIATVYYNVPYYYIESWLQSLTNVKNECY
ncbi:Abi family protein [Halobacillus seohaensis]|uniref:Abi family protein n=1 Tax=Halobacillus seohaensis TaxID=447421 RepID=A0ABW2EP75_9BACI